MVVIKRRGRPADDGKGDESSSKKAQTPQERRNELDSAVFPFWFAVFNLINVIEERLREEEVVLIDIENGELPRDLWLELLYSSVSPGPGEDESLPMSDFRAIFHDLEQVRLSLDDYTNEHDQHIVKVMVFADDRFVVAELLDDFFTEWQGIAMCWLLSWLDVEPKKVRRVLRGQIPGYRKWKQ